MTEIKNLSKKFGKKEVLSDVSLTLDHGVYGLLGPNGAGKTTLMRCILGILPINGGEIDSPAVIGYLPQRFGMYKELTVYEAMEYFAALKKVDPKTQKDDILKCLEEVNLLEQKDGKIRSLSGGMVRRLGIGQALLGSPDLVIFDEPTAGLDPEERIRFKNLISRIKEKYTILISTHIVEDVEAVCDHIIIMNRGKIVVEGDPVTISNYAAGHVFAVAKAEESHLIQPYSILREELYGGEARLRILSNHVQPGEEVAPTLEDGYMYCIHNKV